MRIFDALAALRIARWALEHHHLIPADIRADVALLAERGGQKLPPGLFAVELARLRGELPRDVLATLTTEQRDFVLDLTRAVVRSVADMLGPSLDCTPEEFTKQVVESLSDRLDHLEEKP